MSAPSITELGVPKWGLSMTEGRLVVWLVNENEEVAAGQPVAEIETEKIDGVVEAPVSGLLRRCVAQVGDLLPVGALLGVIADADVSDEAIDSYVAELGAASRKERG